MSINWAHEPPPERRIPHLPLIRLKAAAKLRLALTCTRPLACFCHFFTGRTLPCLSDNCPGCKAERRTIRECYVSGVNGATRQHIMTVMPPGAERQFTDAVPNPDNVRGVVIELQRHGARANGRVTCTVDELQLPTEKLPREPNLTEHLYQVWGLTQDHWGSDHPLWDARAAIDEELIRGNGAHHPPGK